MSDLQLIEAVKAGNPERARELLAAGADVNQQDEQGWTPLNWAAGKGSLPLVSLLVEHGADVSKVGRDLRTPYLIALAAGHAEVVKFLRAAEANPEYPERKYCKAYHLSDLRRFPGWAESRINWKEAPAAAAANSNGSNGNGSNGAGHEQGLSGEDVVFLHQDYTVTQFIWQNENVIFDGVTPEWEAFCAGELGFSVPDDLDLIVPAGEGTAA